MTDGYGNFGSHHDRAAAGGIRCLIDLDQHSAAIGIQTQQLGCGFIFYNTCHGNRI